MMPRMGPTQGVQAKANVDPSRSDRGYPARTRLAGGAVVPVMSLSVLMGCGDRLWCEIDGATAHDGPRPQSEAPSEEE